MNRRELLRQAVTVGVASAAASGCATTGDGGARAQAARPLPDMDEYLARLDRDLEGMDRLQIGPHVAAVLGLEGAEDLAASLQKDDAVVRKAAKALYLTSAFRDLPEEGRAHPGMQRRMWDAAPDMTAAVEGMQQRLRGLPVHERARIQRELKARPELMDSLCRVLDAQVSEAWVQPERRVRQRMVMSSLGWQMQHQSLSAVIDQYLEKADRARAWSGSAAESERRLMAQMGQEAFWASRDRMVAAAQQWEARRAGLGGGGGEPAPEQVPQTPGEQMMGIGLNMMGIGLVTGLGGLVLLTVGSSSGLGFLGMIGTTVGGAVLLIGIIIWLAGSALDASARQTDPAARPRAPAPAPAAPPAGPPPDSPPI
jgi:hypothetical protein